MDANFLSKLNSKRAVQGTWKTRGEREVQDPEGFQEAQRDLFVVAITHSLDSLIGTRVVPPLMNG